MRDKARRRPAALVLLLSLLMVVAALPAAAAAPQPVIAVDDPAGDRGSSGDGTDPGDTAGEDSGVGDDEAPPDEAPPDEEVAGCLLGPSAAAGTLASYPGPVIALPPLPSPCRTRISLSLVVESPDERRPQGAVAVVAGQTVPRAALEAGFSTTLPASSRTISLTDPGQDWEITEVSCTCGGGTATMQLASYPQPVIALPTFDSGARPGSSGCGPAGGSGASLAAGPSTALNAPAGGELTTYPGPIIALPGRDAPATPTEPQEPARTPGTVSWDVNGTVSINDPDRLGGSVSCRWTVELVYGDLTIRTKTEPPGNEGQFRYLVTPASSEHGETPQAMFGSPSGDRKQLWKGNWSVELQDVDKRFELKSSSCEESDTTTVSSASGTTASIGLDGGDRVTCTFELKLLAPRPGSWSAKNGRGVVSCGPPTITLPAVTERGTIRVRRKGDLLIARGLAPGSGTTWRLERDANDPRRYRGKVRLTVAGARGTFTTQLRLIDDERMEGAFSGNVRVRGTRCTFSRPLELTYVGR